VSGEAGPEPPSRERPGTFQGWQRTACLAGVGLLVVFTVLVLVSAILGAIGFH
jgi:hypothetical protein